MRKMEMYTFWGGRRESQRRRLLRSSKARYYD
jgi:hypothetical protein